MPRFRHHETSDRVFFPVNRGLGKGWITRCPYDLEQKATNPALDRLAGAPGWLSGLIDRHDLDTVARELVEKPRNTEGSNPSVRSDLARLFKQLSARSKQVVGISARQDSHVSRHDCRYVRRGTFLRAPGVARLGFSAMVVANLECGVLGISSGLVTDLGDRASDGRADIVSASIFSTVQDGWSQH